MFSPPGQGPLSPGIQQYPVTEHFQAGGQPPVKKQRLSPGPENPTYPQPYGIMPNGTPAYVSSYKMPHSLAVCLPLLCSTNVSLLGIQLRILLDLLTLRMPKPPRAPSLHPLQHLAHTVHLMRTVMLLHL
jgi:hypothetical protein